MSHDQLVEDILIPSDVMEVEDKHLVIEAVQDFVFNLEQALYYREELPSEVDGIIQVYNYIRQIKEGGLSQFVRDTGWEFHTIDGVEEGLRALNAPQHLELFLQMRDEIEALEDDLIHFLEGETSDEEDGVESKIDQLGERYSEIDGEESLLDCLHQYVCELPNLKPLPDDEFADEWEKLLEAVPNKEEREAEAAQLEEENKSLEEMVIREICRQADREFGGITSVEEVEVDGVTVNQWHFLAGEEKRYAIFTAQKVELYREDGELLLELTLG